MESITRTQTQTGAAEDMAMTTELAARILTAHGVPVAWFRGGAELMALDVVMGRAGEDLSTWVTVDGWTEAQLMAWLGY